MHARIICRLKDPDKNRHIKRLFKQAKCEVLPDDAKDNADFEVISLSPKAMLSEIHKKLNKGKGNRFIVFMKGSSTAEQKRWIFGGNTLSLHNMDDPKEFHEAVNRVFDELFLRQFLQLGTKAELAPFRLFAVSTSAGISVIDRSYKCRYRNQKHVQILGRSKKPYGLCWQEFRRLYNQDEPCKGCPTKVIFKPDGKGQINLPNPKLLVRSRGSICLCTRLQVLPVVDRHRKRVAASIEIMSILKPEDYCNDVSVQENLLASALEAILDGNFTRSRIFIYVGKTKLLRGFEEKYLDEKHGKIKADFRNMVLPSAKYDKKVFEKRVPVPLKYNKKRFEGQLHAPMFQKERAPVWVEFPLLDGKLILGKLLVDKYKANGPVVRKQISRREINNIRPYAEFMSKILKIMGRFTDVRDADILSHCQKTIVDKIAATDSPRKVLDTLVQFLPQCMEGIIYSAYVRVANDKKKRLELCGLGVGPHWDKFAKKFIPMDGKYISALAYDSEQPVVATLSENERRRILTKLKKICPALKEPTLPFDTKCSIPVTIFTNGGSEIRVLCIQGTKRLHDQKVIELLQETANVATNYSSSHSHSRKKQVLVLGQYDGNGLERLNRICGIIRKKNYEAFLVKERSGIPEDSLVNKVLVYAVTSRFVIIEDSFPAGQLVEFMTCTTNQILTIILREEGKTSTILSKGSTVNFRFVKEYEYTNDSLEHIIAKAIKWADWKIKERKKQYNELYDNEKVSE